MVELVLVVVGAALGGFVSWYITHQYHIKASKEQRDLFDKLSTEVRQAIMASPKNTLETEEIMQILNDIASGPVDTGRLRGPIDGGTF